MKKILAVLLACVMLLAVAAPVMAFAADDKFVPSVQQEDPVDKEPNVPNTDEGVSILPAAGAVVFAAAAAGFFVVAGKSKKQEG